MNFSKINYIAQCTQHIMGIAERFPYARHFYVGIVQFWLVEVNVSLILMSAWYFIPQNRNNLVLYSVFYVWAMTALLCYIYYQMRSGHPGPVSQAWKTWDGQSVEMPPVPDHAKKADDFDAIELVSSINRQQAAHDHSHIHSHDHHGHNHPHNDRNFQVIYEHKPPPTAKPYVPHQVAEYVIPMDQTGQGKKRLVPLLQQLGQKETQMRQSAMETKEDEESDDDEKAPLKPSHHHDHLGEKHHHPERNPGRIIPHGVGQWTPMKMPQWATTAAGVVAAPVAAPFVLSGPGARVTSPDETKDGGPQQPQPIVPYAVPMALDDVQPELAAKFRAAQQRATQKGLRSFVPVVPDGDLKNMDIHGFLHKQAEQKMDYPEWVQARQRLFGQEDFQPMKQNDLANLGSKGFVMMVEGDAEFEELNDVWDRAVFKPMEAPEVTDFPVTMKDATGKVTKISGKGKTDYCHMCGHYKPPRTHHCKRCHTCVDRMDHHCIWLGVCVGRRNHRYFLQYVFWYPVMSVWIGYLSLVRFWTNPWSWFVLLDIWHVWWGFSLPVMAFMLLRYQLNNMGNDVSGMEAMFDPSLTHGQYSKGSMWENLKRYLGDSFVQVFCPVANKPYK